MLNGFGDEAASVPLYLVNPFHQFGRQSDCDTFRRLHHQSMTYNMIILNISWRAMPLEAVLWGDQRRRLDTRHILRQRSFGLQLAVFGGRSPRQARAYTRREVRTLHWGSP